MNQAAAVSSSYVTLPLSQIFESSTNPRRTFEPSKLVELAQSIAAHGLIQPITVRPQGELYEIVAGARRFRAAQLAELENVPTCIRELSDDQALEVQIVENSQREDVHPYEEAAGYDALLRRPGYDVPALAAKCGKSESHVYSRLSLLSLITEAVEAFQQERITATHANLLARLTPEQQQAAFPHCWRKDYRDGEEHLLAARFLGAWIRQNLYLPLDKAPFDREDAVLLPQAGACPACPKRSGFNAALFCDLQEDEQCLDAICYQAKIGAHVERELAADGGLIAIEAGYRPPSEQRVGSIPLRELLVLKDDSPRYDAAERGIIVYGNRVGTILPVCSDEACPVHNPEVAQANAARARAEQAAAETRAREEEAARNAPKPTEQEAEQARQKDAAVLAEQERLEAETRETRLRLAEEDEERRRQREAEQQRRDEELEAEAKRHVAGVNEDDRRGADEVMHEAIQRLTDTRISRFAVTFALACHRSIPLLGQADLLVEAENVFAPSPATETTDKQPQADKKERRKA